MILNYLTGASLSSLKSIKKAKCMPHDLINHTSLALIGAVKRAWSRNYKVTILEIILATIDVLLLMFCSGEACLQTRPALHNGLDDCPLILLYISHPKLFT